MPYNEEVEKLINRINSFDKLYLNAVLHDISDGLEIISGLPKNRIYLSIPSYYGSKKEVLEPLHVRGHAEDPVKTTPIAINDDVGENSFSLSQPLQDTYEGKAYKSAKSLMAADYAESDMKGSALLGKAMNIKSSLIFPIIVNDRILGVLTLDSVEYLKQDTFLSFKDVIAEFLKAVAQKLSEVMDYWLPIIHERSVEEAMRANKISLILESPIREGIADLAVLMAPSLDTVCGEKIRCLVPFSLRARSEDDKKLFEETLRDNRYVGRMILDSQAFILTSKLMEWGEPRSEVSNTPSFLSLGDFACPFEIDLQKKAGFTAAIFYPVVNKQKDLLYAVILYLKKDAAKKVKTMPSGADGKSLLKSKMKALGSQINSVLYGLSACSLVTDHLLKIYEVNQRYEDFNRMKDIRKGLTEFLHMILFNIMVIIGADCGTIGVVGNINGKKYVIVEREGEVVVGAKAGDIHNSFIWPVRVGTPDDLLTKELSLSGIAAAQGKTKVAFGAEGMENEGFFKIPCNEMKSTIAIPIVVGQETIAVINLGSRKKYLFTGSIQKILEMISEMVAENVHKLIKKYEVSVEVIKLYGGRYPYIKNDALNYLAELYHAYFIDLSKFLDDILQNYKSRRRDRKDKENHITLKDIKMTYLDSNLERINLEEYLEKADNDVANYIYLMLKNKKTSFFEAVQDAYSRHDISRNVALLIFEKAKLTLPKPQITKIAAHLNVCSENYKSNYEEKKKIERFRQFYKKTIGIKI